MICDPLDGSCDLVAEDALYTALKRSDGYLASFHQPPDIHTASAEAVLDRALAWRATGGVGVAAEDFPFVERWHGGPREQISLRYGLMNGAVQMSKTVRFFTDAGLLGRPAAERLTQMLMDVPDIWKNPVDCIEERVVSGWLWRNVIPSVRRRSQLLKSMVRPAFILMQNGSETGSAS